MKTKSMIRKMFGMMFLLCLCQVVFGQKKSEHKGIPMRDAISAESNDPLENMLSMRIPLFVCVNVDDWRGAGVKGVAVVVKVFECRFGYPDYGLETTILDGFTGSDGGIIAPRNIFKESISVLYLNVTISYRLFAEKSIYFSKKYRVDSFGPTTIDIVIERDYLGIRGTVSDAYNQKTDLEFE